MLHKRWKETSFVAIDLETTGKYPLEAEICEMAAIKVVGGQVVDRMQTLIRPSRPMSDFVISIHNITNEMVAAAPRLEEQLPQFHKFIADSCLVAHHAPFDMGFLAEAFERMNLSLPTLPAFCTSLMAIALFPELETHRLAFLKTHFGIESGPAHRAMADAEGCLAVARHCFEYVGVDATMADLIRAQGRELSWSQYSLDALKEKQALATIFRAIQESREVQLVYGGGSNPGKPRAILPIGVVRNPNGDFVVAYERRERSDENLTDRKPKRYMIDKIISCSHII